MSSNLDWKTNDYSKKDQAIQAVEIETNQFNLGEMSKKAPLLNVCALAVKRLVAPNVLADVAKNATYSYVRRVAVEKLNDQDVLADV
ncbi:MAG: hypothetical protein FWG55_01195, partial [Candidatus Bathyarchaeota archaeon]|nr:hypothetical protein [Candidatus Termiticorpusculum sp.]